MCKFHNNKDKKSANLQKGSAKIMSHKIYFNHKEQNKLTDHAY